MSKMCTRPNKTREIFVHILRNVEEMRFCFLPLNTLKRGSEETMTTGGGAPRTVSEGRMGFGANGSILPRGMGWEMAVSWLGYARKLARVRGGFGGLISV